MMKIDKAKNLQNTPSKTEEPASSGMQLAPPPFQLKASDLGGEGDFAGIEVTSSEGLAEKEADSTAMEVVNGSESEGVEKSGLSQEDEGILEVIAGSPELAGLMEQEMGLPVNLPENEASSGETLKVQRKSAPSGTGVVTSSFQDTLQRKAGKGNALSTDSQAEMGGKIGGDFGKVSVHTDQEAIQMNQEIGSEAFAVGNDVYFNQGNYKEGTIQGKFLLAHELTHVAQHQRSGGEQQGGAKVQPFFGKLWNGIKSAGKFVANAVVGGVKWIGSVGGSLAGWLWKVITKFPQRLGTLIWHILKVAWKLPMWLWEGLVTMLKNPSGLGKWLWEGIKGGAAWVGRLIAKLFDIVGGGEVMDVLFSLIKPNTRFLESAEITEARKVLGGSVPYWMVRIDEASVIAKIGALMQGSSGMGVTLWHTINFNRKISPSPGNGDMHWLVHELTHVAQYEATGSQYLGEAVAAQNSSAGYGYGGPAGLVGMNLSDFNREQQGDVVADAYSALVNGTINADQQRMVTQAKNAQF